LQIQTNTRERSWGWCTCLNPKYWDFSKNKKSRMKRKVEIGDSTMKPTSSFTVQRKPRESVVGTSTTTRDGG
jgi:hypothetical protein